MKITIPLLGSAGVVKDIQPHELPLSALSDATNVRFRDGAAERITGDKQIFATAANIPYQVMLYRTATTLFLVHAHLAAVFVDSSSARTDITGTAPTGGAGDHWTGGVFVGTLIMNNGKDKPMFWAGDTANNLATLTNWDANHTCKVLRPWKNYLVALDITKTSTRYKHMVKWSAAADPGTLPAWDETDAATDAGEIDLAETTDNMVDALPLGDSLVIYKTASCYSMTYIGGQYVFQFRRLPGEWGMLAPNCGCIVPAGHVVLTAGDVVLNTGAGMQSILSNRMRKWLFDAMDTTYYDRSFVVSNPSKNEVWICFPTVGASVCTQALIWNWTENTFALRDLDSVTAITSGQFEYAVSDPWSTDAAAWDADTTIWDTSDIPLAQSSLIMGTTDKYLLVADDSVTQFHAEDYTSRIERKGLAFDAPDQVKLLRGITPRIDGTAGQTVYIQGGGAMDAEGNYTWSEPVPYVVGTTRKADLFATGRFLAYRIYSTTGMGWRVRSIDLDVQPMGGY
ncbi:MAG: hypothetical protein QG619_2750 [Pseudomonadota bacterium]|nr:hypothetical protein [Pseudomonadota bacterium]